MMRSLIIMLTLLALLPAATTAQVWDKSFEKEVNLIKMTDAGVAVIGTDDALYGIDSEGSVLWRNEKLKKVEAERVEILSGSELIFVSDKGMLSRNRAINVMTGKEYADDGVKFSQIFAATTLHSTNQILVMPTPGQLDAWDINSNTFQWTLGGNFPHGFALEKSVALTNTFAGAQPVKWINDTQGIMHLGLAHLARYDFTTGQPVWEFNWKDYKVKAGEGKDSPSMPSRGYALMKLSDDRSTLYFPFRMGVLAIDAETGAPKWEHKAHKLGGIAKDMYVTKHGLLVLTPTGLQLLDFATGAAKWDKQIKIKGAADGLLMQDGEDFYTISKKYLMKVDVAAGTASQMTDKIKFEGGESYSGLEVRDDFIVMYADQNVIGIDKASGGIAWSHYYKPPGASWSNIAANVALATVSAAITLQNYSNARNRAMAGANPAVAYQPISFEYTQVMIQINPNGGSATQGDGKNMYINTKFKDSDASGFGLAKIDKSSGQLVDKIIVGDREPVYAVDETAKLIFYKSDKKTVACKKVN